MGSTDKFTGTDDGFSLWQIKMKVLLVHIGLLHAINLEVLENTLEKKKIMDSEERAHIAILLSLGDEVLREVAEETTALAPWNRLAGLYLKKSLPNMLYLKKSLYVIHMEEGKYLRKHI